MKEIYEKIWKLALPYYEKGRPMDIDHIEWMMKDAMLVCKKEALDDSLLLPLVILHDVGYANCKKDNPYKLDMRKKHMMEGAKIAEKILIEVNYPKEKSVKIAHYISIHDNWAFGDYKIYEKEKLLGVFRDLDFIWVVTQKGFPAMQKVLSKNKKEMLKYSIEQGARTYHTKTAKKLFEKYLQDRKNEIQ